jgi:GntR family transcriptional regulator / MocR family aminotransferase
LLGPLAKDRAAFVAIADAIVAAITQRRLPEGAKLPGSRTLADSLGMHRNTVVAAYQELEAQGWVATMPAKGTFVVTPPTVFTTSGASQARAAFSLPSGGAPSPFEDEIPSSKVIVLAGGTPDLALVPQQALARAYRHALKKRAHFDYGDGKGHPRLRAALATMLKETRGLGIDADDLLVTRGSQQALTLAARVLVRPGDHVAVEALGYPPAWRALRREGATLVPIAIDGDGLDIDALERVLKRTKLRALYLTPHHQYPTLATLSAPRRHRLLHLAERHGFAIIEDDYDHEFHYARRPVLPLASAGSASVIYIGTLSKILAPALRTGYVVAPRDVLRAMHHERLVLDRQGDQLLDAALATLFEEGEVQRHARRMRRIYAARRDKLISLLADNPRVRFDRPDGGMSLWVELLGNTDADHVAKAALKRGVWVAPASRFTLSGVSLPFLRIGYAANTERTLTDAVLRLQL